MVCDDDTVDRKALTDGLIRGGYKRQKGQWKQRLLAAKEPGLTRWLDAVLETITAWREGENNGLGKWKHSSIRLGVHGSVLEGCGG